MPARQDHSDTTVWERPEPPNRPALTPLSRDAIVRAAMTLADADGLVAVSLRKVGAALDAGPMRIYGYVATKDELLDLLVDQVYGEIVPVEPTGDWRADLVTIALRTRSAALRHEWFVDLLSGRPHLGPNALAHMEAGLSTLDGVPGFADIDVRMQAAGAVMAYVTGRVRGEVAERRAERASGLSERQWQDASGPYMQRMLDTGRFPNLDRVVREARHPGGEDAFLAGLDYVLAGIAAHTLA